MLFFNVFFLLFLCNMTVYSDTVECIYFPFNYCDQTKNAYTKYFENLFIIEICIRMLFQFLNLILKEKV